MPAKGIAGPTPFRPRPARSARGGRWPACITAPRADQLTRRPPRPAAFRKEAVRPAGQAGERQRRRSQCQKWHWQCQEWHSQCQK